MQNSSQNDEEVWPGYGFVWFYDISTNLDYLMPYQFVYILTVLFQTNQFIIGTQFSSNWRLERTLSGVITPG